MSELVKTIADFSTTLASKVAVGATTATLTSATDDDGITLPAGTYGFTIDRNSSNKEYFTADLNGTSLTGIKTVTRGTGVGTSGLVRAHRKGAEVIISDHVALKRMMDLLDGTTALDHTNPYLYTDEPTFTYGNHEIVTWDKAKDYTDSVAIAGGVDASTTVKGIVKLSVAPASATEPIAVGTNDTRFATSSGTALSGANKVIDEADVSDAGVTGKIVRANGTALPELDGSNLLNTAPIISLTASENITAGQAVSVGGEVYTDQQTISTTTTHSSANGTYSQSFTTPDDALKIKSVAVFLSSAYSGRTAEFAIYADSAGKPTGSALATSGSVTLSSPSVGESTAVFATALSVSPSTTYHVVSVNLGADEAWHRADTTGQGAHQYSGGVWNAINGPFALRVNYYDTVSGTAYKASAASNSQRANSLVGFATENITSGNAGNIKVGGVVTGLSGLTPGATYYLSNTAGAISTSAGTVSRKVGVAISATELLIKHENV